MIISIPVISFQAGYAQTQPQQQSDLLLDSIIDQKEQEEEAKKEVTSTNSDPLLNDLLNQNNKDQQAKQQQISGSQNLFNDVKTTLLSKTDFKFTASLPEGLTLDARLTFIPNVKHEITQAQEDEAKAKGLPVYNIRRSSDISDDNLEYQVKFFVPYSALPADTVKAFQSSSSSPPVVPASSSLPLTVPSSSPYQLPTAAIIPIQASGGGSGGPITPIPKEPFGTAKTVKKVITGVEGVFYELYEDKLFTEGTKLSKFHKIFGKISKFVDVVKWGNEGLLIGQELAKIEECGKNRGKTLQEFDQKEWDAQLEETMNGAKVGVIGMMAMKAVIEGASKSLGKIPELFMTPVTWYSDKVFSHWIKYDLDTARQAVGKCEKKEEKSLPQDPELPPFDRKPPPLIEREPDEVSSSGSSKGAKATILVVGSSAYDYDRVYHSVSGSGESVTRVTMLLEEVPMYKEVFLESSERKNNSGNIHIEGKTHSKESPPPMNGCGEWVSEWNLNDDGVGWRAVIDRKTSTLTAETVDYYRGWIPSGSQYCDGRKVNSLNAADYGAVDLGSCSLPASFKIVDGVVSFTTTKTYPREGGQETVRCDINISGISMPELEEKCDNGEDENYNGKIDEGCIIPAEKEQQQPPSPQEPDVEPQEEKEKEKEKEKAVDTKYISIVPGASKNDTEAETNGYDPTQYSSVSGALIIWRNNDYTAHMVVSGNPSDGPTGAFNSGYIKPGGVFSIVGEPGTYEYYCVLHPHMVGQINVK